MSRLERLEITTGESTTVKLSLQALVDGEKLPNLKHVVIPRLGGGLTTFEEDYEFKQV